MRRHLISIICIATLLSVPAAVSSCSVEMMDKDEAEGNIPTEKGILVTGSVSDNQGNALEDITITFEAYPRDNASAAAVSSEITYTNSKGTYSILARGADMPLMCTVTAEDRNGRFESMSQQIIVQWKGTSFDKESNTFIVNDCNFKMSEK